MQAETKELWLELCEQAANEQDQDKFLAIVREISAASELKIGHLKQSGPQLVLDASELTRCALCDKPVPLDTSKTDENGEAVHEECYVLKMRLKRATSKNDDVHP
ncbi:MAG: hypothetical protein WB660_14895 [Candidatus Sulfotelmatobacter sp.]